MSAIENPNLLDHGVLRFLTAGSVDDGKSTLIGRLLYDTKAILADQLAAIEQTSKRRGQALDLSLLTDGLVAEREQGITIDVAYRYFATALRKFIIADAPGHEQYTRNMVTAASTAHLAILLVDARHGVVAQTRRHATIAHLLGISHLVVAVNKMDLVDWRRDVYDAIVADFRAFAGRAGMGGDVVFVPMSALEGDMIVDRGRRLAWYEGPTLLQILETAEVPTSLERAPFRFPVQYVSRPTATLPRAYMGRIESGAIAVGDHVTALPSGLTTTVREIRTFDGSLARAGLHAAVALVLADELDISRGDMLAHADAIPATTRRIDATVCWLADEALDPRRTYLLRHTTREVRAGVLRIDHLWNTTTQLRVAAPARLARNDIGDIALMLTQPVFADRYLDNRATGGFILIDEATNGTVGAGMVR